MLKKKQKQKTKPKKKKNYCYGEKHTHFRVFINKKKGSNES
jgi:hypothetical protein